MKSKILLVQNDKKYHLASLDYSKQDASIYLFIKNHSGKIGKYGITEITGGHFKIKHQ